MRILGLDLGTKTLGLAITDRSNTLASSLKVLRYTDYEQLISELKEIVNDKDIGLFVLGLPKNMDNTLGEASNRSLNFKKILEENFDIPVELVDERLSTVEAEKFLLEADLSRKKRKTVIDGVAASIILESYLRRRENDGKQQ